MEETELLPCPFCGGRADFESVEAPIMKSGAGSWSVGCFEDGGDLHESGMCFGYQSATQFATKRDAAAAWNRRAALSKAGA